MAKIEFILNPKSGVAGKDDFENILLRNSFFSGHTCVLHRTEYPLHAEKIAKEAVERGADMVVAVGGDGTVNEVGRALAGSSCTMAIVPCGSGNGLARHIGIPCSFSKALDTIAAGHTEMLDYGLIDGRPFFCTCGAGFDAEVSREFAKAGKRGFFSYVRIAIMMWFRYKPQRYRISVGSSSGGFNVVFDEEAFLVTVANASQWGNNAYIAPIASLKDGLLDVVIIKPFSFLRSFKLATDLFLRKIDSNSNVIALRCKRLRIIRQGIGTCHLDGDPYLEGEIIDVQIVPSKLRMIVPRENK